MKRAIGVLLLTACGSRDSCTVNCESIPPAATLQSICQAAALLKELDDYPECLSKPEADNGLKPLKPKK